MEPNIRDRKHTKVHAGLELANTPSLPFSEEVVNWRNIPISLKFPKLRAD
jgi:hypothetical protein